MRVYDDERIVMTLDAGGTNFVFSALQGGKEIVEAVTLPSHASDRDLCLKVIIKGFETVKSILSEAPVAISFAFPGPADYKNGIIGDLPNFPSFRGGVALGPMLEHIFNLPTFINNDGDLFTYGEAMTGFLPFINGLMKEQGIEKEYRNLFGITLGTGFGGGLVIDNQLCDGDNSAAGEIWLMRNFRNTRVNAEEGVSIRAVQRVYKEGSGTSETLSPKDIYDIAMKEKDGDREAALKAFDEMSRVIAESLANAITLIDGPIVIGGGIAGASKLILPKVVEYMNGKIENLKGEQMPRLISKVYNAEDEASRRDFTDWETAQVKIPFTDKQAPYNSEKRIAVGLSRLGTSRAISLGAYALALERIP